MTLAQLAQELRLSESHVEEQLAALDEVVASSQDLCASSHTHCSVPLPAALCSWQQQHCEPLG